MQGCCHSDAAFAHFAVEQSLGSSHLRGDHHCGSSATRNGLPRSTIAGAEITEMRGEAEQNQNSVLLQKGACVEVGGPYAVPQASG